MAGQAGEVMSRSCADVRGKITLTKDRRAPIERITGIAPRTLEVAVVASGLVVAAPPVASR